MIKPGLSMCSGLITEASSTTNRSDAMSLEFPERFNMADYFLYHNLEEGRESKVCLYFKDQTFTYGDAARMSSRVDNALRAAGVAMEYLVLIVLPDCPEIVSPWFASARIS